MHFGFCMANVVLLSTTVLKLLFNCYAFFNERKMNCNPTKSYLYF